MKYIASVLLLCCLVACGGNKSTSAAATPVEGASNGTLTNGTQMSSENASNIPDCGAVKAVWVNTKTKVYHEPGDPRYGHTKHGKYMCPSQAKKEGDRPAGGAKHHSNSM
ncbi:MAG TPA: hypothetical protein VGG89_00700 [Candidatus Baltobacteraceae bacterium]|jgi:hypothetical protein